MESNRAARKSEVLAPSKSAIRIKSSVTGLIGMGGKTRSYFRTVPKPTAASKYRLRSPTPAPANAPRTAPALKWFGFYLLAAG